ncbi:ZIP family metal transporter [Chelativorans sp. AA-79]|uniref:ZIP family metal transporter n=1 Tax=Chelativorans sp. AA-79 TaxID=3028735 RepID=UPI0023FA4065|nr:ZIP family metal transporter [Chelativorans sp. AA-79]WEX07988.1 peptidoglycan-binding protein [Chelativorans sp. AA-79]
MVVGTVLAELTGTSRRTLSRALHVASGVVLAVVAVELLPESLGGAAPPWAVVLGLCLGGAFYILLEWLIERSAGGEESAGAWMIYTAVAVDLFSDGLMIGVGSVLSLQLALLLGLGQSMADLPEGFATAANFKNKGQPRGRRLLVAASLILPSLAGASLGYWLLRDRSEALQLTALAFTAGILLIAAVEEMLKQAHEVAEDTRLSAAFLIGGFSLFTIFASYFDS